MISEMRLGLCVTLCSALTLGSLACDHPGPAAVERPTHPAETAVIDLPTAPSASASSRSPSTPEPHMVSAVEEGASRRLMPKGCDRGRAYMNMTKLLDADVIGAWNSVQDKIVLNMVKANGLGPESAESIDAALNAQGLSVAALSEVSLCVRPNGEGVIALAFDPSQLKSDLLSAAIAVSTAAAGAAPRKDEVNGFMLLGGKNRGAVKGNVVLTADDDADLRAVVEHAGAGADDFSEGEGDVVWVKTGIGSPEEVTATMKVVGDKYELGAVVPSSLVKVDLRNLSSATTQLRESIKQKITSSPLEALLPSVGTIELTVGGNTVVGRASIPRAALGKVARAVARDPKGTYMMMQ